MGGLTSYAQNKFLNHCLNESTWTKPTVYMALSTTDFTVAGTEGNEPTGNGYARIALAPGFDAASNRVITNAADITFAAASGGGWGTLQYFAFFDALTGGNCLAFGTFSSAVTVYSGQTAKIVSGTLTVEIEAGTRMTTYLANKMLDHILGDASYTPETIYVGMATGTLGDTGVFTNEVANAGGYAREAHSYWSITGKNAENNGIIDFGTATANWGTITGVFLATSGTHGGGDMLIYGTVDTPQAVATNDDAIWASGAMDLSMT